jgi:hypothetical protein
LIMSSRRPQATGAMVPQQQQSQRRRRPQAPQSSQSLVPHQQQSQRQRRPNNELVPREQQQQRGQTSNALVPHQPRPKQRQQQNALVAYEEPMSYRDEYEPPPERPFMAQFCEPRCFILLLLILFFGLLLLIAVILLIMSLDKGDPDGLAGWTYPIPARDPSGTFVHHIFLRNNRRFRYFTLRELITTFHYSRSSLFLQDTQTLKRAMGLELRFAALENSLPFPLPTVKIPMALLEPSFCMCGSETFMPCTEAMVF